MRNQQIQSQWLAAIAPSPHVARVAVTEPQSRAAWQDVNVIIQGHDWPTLYRAASFAKQQLQQYASVFNITDNSGLGAFEYEIIPKPSAMALGVTQQMIATQLKHLLRGSEVVVNYLPGSEKQTVRVQMAPQHFHGESDLPSLPIHVQGQQMMLADVAEWHLRQQPDVFYQYNGQLAIRVGADVDRRYDAAHRVRQLVARDLVPEVTQRFQVKVLPQLASPDTQETAQDLFAGVLLGLVVVYFVLAWVTRSYLWPVVMMMTLPMVFSGAVLGHYWLAMDWSLLSVIAGLGLSGVVIHISLQLLLQCRALRLDYPKLSLSQLVIKSICYRFRAMLLTLLSLGFYWGPLCLIHAQQAQWLQPLAVTLFFGLLFSLWCLCCAVPAAVALLAHRLPVVGLGDDAHA